MAIGWGVLALLLILLAALVAMAPKTVVSLLPGSARLYAMMGMNVNPLGLTIENVRSAWNDAGPERVLQVDGDIVNLTAGEVKVPAVVVSLQDAERQGAVASHGGRDAAWRRRPNRPSRCRFPLLRKTSAISRFSFAKAK